MALSMSSQVHMLQKIAELDNRIQEYEYEPCNDEAKHWLHLKPGWACGILERHSIHEATARECVLFLQSVEPCRCSECSEYLRTNR